MGLVIMRKPGECIEIGGATVRIGRVKGKEVRLIVEAPRSVGVRKPSHEEDLIDRMTYEEMSRRHAAEKRGGSQ